MGTSDINENSVNKAFIGEMKSTITQTIGQGFGMTFDAHMMAGHRFIMRFYEMLEFTCLGSAAVPIQPASSPERSTPSAFSAKATRKWRILPSDSTSAILQARFKMRTRQTRGRQRGQQTKRRETKANQDRSEKTADKEEAKKTTDGEIPKTKDAPNEITTFGQTFCRGNGGGGEGNVKIFFLGMWDCVNSIAVLDHRIYKLRPVSRTTHQIRHAVALDERRVKLKPALLAQDILQSKPKDEDIKEV
ncbi:hypothetical protein PT974_03661 [Cladobotryum mycophilum]|uniref:T6SS Phospholipase effector Tle1-like catalytic domain-containing protein n=1 Tax=Cladobotryum mycophilum TaxID=491253 RepID=A0ABR0SSZ0_9HYPO